MSEFPTFQTLISPDPIRLPASWSGSPEFGADLQFLGVVRGTEEGKAISGIDYSCYQDMALREFQAIAEQGQSDFDTQHRCFMQHRIGFVPVAEPSLFIGVQAAHSREAFALSEFYLREVKSRLPIWKKVEFLP
ncbi:MAG: molybdenum cofactor biosynthesis protein MoaE [Verrucomicrobiota bacterium]